MSSSPATLIEANINCSSSDIVSILTSPLVSSVQKVAKLDKMHNNFIFGPDTAFKDSHNVANILSPVSRIPEQHITPSKIKDIHISSLLCLEMQKSPQNSHFVGTNEISEFQNEECEQYKEPDYCSIVECCSAEKNTIKNQDLVLHITKADKRICQINISKQNL